MILLLSIIIGITPCIEDIGTYDTTGYYLWEGSCGYTYTGVVPKAEKTIASDPYILPLNSWVYIEGVGIRHVEDTGVKGKVIDIFFNTYDECVSWGCQPRHVYRIRWVKCLN